MNPDRWDLPIAAFGAAWQVRPDMSTAEFTELAEAVMLDADARRSLIRIWDRHRSGRLTALERATLQAIVSPEGSDPLDGVR